MSPASAARAGLQNHLQVAFDSAHPVVAGPHAVVAGPPAALAVGPQAAVAGC